MFSVGFLRSQNAEHVNENEMRKRCIIMYLLWLLRHVTNPKCNANNTNWVPLLTVCVFTLQNVKRIINGVIYYIYRCVFFSSTISFCSGWFIGSDKNLWILHMFQSEFKTAVNKLTGCTVHLCKHIKVSLFVILNRIWYEQTLTANRYQPWLEN